MQPLVELIDVSFAYPGRDEPVFENVNARVFPAEMVLVRGPSGMGKSTLIRLLTRLDEVDSGRILFKGVDITEMKPTALRRGLAHVGQIPAMAPGTVRDNLLMAFGFAANKGLSAPDDHSLKEYLGRFLLPTDLDARASALSIGQRQRLCLIRSMLLNPVGLVLDEPTSGLDPESKEAVERDLLRLNREMGLTVIMVSHRSFDESPGQGTGPATEWLVADGTVKEIRP